MDPSFGENSTATEVAAVLRQHITGKVVLITGASPGSLGAQTALAIADHAPKLLIVAGRSTTKISEAAGTIKKRNNASSLEVRTLNLELSTQAQVRKAAEEVNGYKEEIDVVIMSAGVMAAPYAITDDGIESQFAVNHIGHFLFVNLIANKFSRPCRLIGLTSEGYGASGVRFDDPNFESGDYDKWLAYGQSKTAVILLAIGLAKRMKRKGVTAFSLHPGLIETEIMRHMDSADTEFSESGSAGHLYEAICVLTEHFHRIVKGAGIKQKTLDGGAATIVAAAFTPNVDQINGSYWKDCHPTQTMEHAVWTRGEDNADKLWALSENCVGQEFD